MRHLSKRKRPLRIYLRRKHRLHYRGRYLSRKEVRLFLKAVQKAIRGARPSGFHWWRQVLKR